MEGGDLNMKIKESGTFNEEKSAYLILQILSALEYMHSKGYIHRDLKMGNIMFKDNSGLILKIIDFGFVEKIGNKFAVQKCGTGGYLAPEIFSAPNYDQKVDIFSAGIILYTLLKGKNPFRVACSNETLRRNKECDLSFINESDLSAKLQEFLNIILNPNPILRPSASGCKKIKWLQVLCSKWEEDKDFEEMDIEDENESTLLSSKIGQFQNLKNSGHKFDISNIKPQIKKISKLANMKEINEKEKNQIKEDPEEIDNSSLDFKISECL